LALIYGRLLERRECYWPQIAEIARSIEAALTDEEIIEILELLFADGSINIDNYDSANDHWIIRADI
jgi:hypothetical protein